MTPIFRAATRGAALVEYAVLLAAMAVIFPVIILFGDEIPDLFDDLPEIPLSSEITVVIPPCAVAGTCTPPPEVIDWCLENTLTGEVCDLIPVVPVRDPAGDPNDWDLGGGGLCDPGPADPGGPDVPCVLFPVTTGSGGDPMLQWAVTQQNENYSPRAYANRAGLGDANHNEIIGHNVNYFHPAASYCESRDMVLPNYKIMRAIYPYRSNLGLVSNNYWTSSQYNSYGDYSDNIFWAINYAQIIGYMSPMLDAHLNPTSWAYTRCAYRR